MAIDLQATLADGEYLRRLGTAPDGEALAVDYHDVVVTFPSDVAQGDSASAWRAPRAGTLIETEIWCDIAPTTATIIVDLHKNGTTVYTGGTERPVIAISSTADKSGAPSVTSIAAGDLFQFQVDQLNVSDEGSIGQLLARITWSDG